MFVFAAHETAGVGSWFFLSEVFEFLLEIYLRTPKSIPISSCSQGVAGAISYTVVELSFFAIALPIGYFAWHASTGEWLRPLLLLAEDGVEGKARLLGLLLSYVVLLKSFFPVRLGSTLLLTPYAKRAVDALPRLGADTQARRALKDELLDLAAASRGGLTAFDAEQQARFDQAIARLADLNPTREPARSPLFNGRWVCRWTTEQEINFAVEKGLFGLPWVSTYQDIDLQEQTLENTIEFEGGSLRVGSTIQPDDDLGARFNFAFEQCSVKWRSLTVPLPPVGRGWGDLLYLDEEMRIQRDLRGNLLVATRAAVQAP